MKEKQKNNLIWIIVAILAGIFTVISFKINDLMAYQNAIGQDLSQVEYLSSSTQRLSRMIITDDKDNRVVFYIDEETTKNLDIDSSESLTLIENDEIKELAEQVMTNWQLLYTLFDLDLRDPDATYDIDAIKLASDNHFNSMTNLSIKITEESNALSTQIDELQLMSYTVLILIVFCLGNYVISTSMALRSSAELAVVASLDMATGLYNRSKCQEIFKDSTPTNREQQPAVIVIDLNDLKKTNDIFGHRVGDELIASFAYILKEAINLHTVRPFLGRYGGDEFVVYHTDIEKEEDILSFINELAYLTSEFNKQENKKFTVSYAVGYAINKDGKVGFSTRQLFEEADENMYNNKREMKKSQQEQSDKLKEGGEQLA